MFIKRNHTQHAGKPYQSVLLVQGKRRSGRRAPGRPPVGSPPPKSAVVHETLANLSRLPAELIELIDSYCKQRAQDSSTAPRATGPPSAAPSGALGPQVHVGPCYGLLAALHALAPRAGGGGRGGGNDALAALGPLPDLCPAVGHQGSRLSAARWSEDQAVREVLQVGQFDEDDLYAALEYLDQTQSRIEMALAPKPESGGAQSVFL